MRLIAIAALLLSIGCATTNSRDAIRPGSVEMIGDFEAREAARFAHLARADRDGTVSTRVQVCVAPNGRASSSEVVESSGSDRFDDAARRDVTGASYRTFEAPAEVKVCNNLRVVLDEG
jgi:TonB family protein